ncbi:hypothetical protein Avbf_01969 [Armadillidium vulgare]|nr:hypothetical protein Avbf_01969 [Armadillidium vulgare]
MFLQNPMNPPDQVDDLSISPRKVKHHSLRLKQRKSKRLYNYSKLSNEAWPDNIPIVAAEHNPNQNEAQLISFEEHGSTLVRQKSYSASDLTQEGQTSMSQNSITNFHFPVHHDSNNTGSPLLQNNISNQQLSAHTYRNIENSGVDVPKETAVYQNFTNDDSLSDVQTPLYPVRPAPPVVKFPKDIYDEPPDEAVCPPTNSKNNLSSNVPSCASNSHKEATYPSRSSDESPLYPKNISRKHSNQPEIYSSSTSYTVQTHNLNEQIENMWLKNITRDLPHQTQPLNNEGISNTHMPSQSSKNNYRSRETLTPPFYMSGNKRHPSVTFSSNIKVPKCRSSFALPHSSPLKDNISQSTPSLVPLPSSSHNYTSNQVVDSSFQFKENAFPKLDASFISELEKNLGKDQASANTYKCEEKHIASPTLLPEKVDYTSVPSKASASHIHEFNLSASQPNLRESVEISSSNVNSQALSKPKMNFTPPFSDLDVLTSSRTLGLSPKEGLDISKYFEKSNQKNLSLSALLVNRGRNPSLFKPEEIIWPSNASIMPNSSLSVASSNHSNILPLCADFRTSSNVPPIYMQSSSSGTQVQQPHQNALPNLNQRAPETMQPTVVLSPQLTVNYNQTLFTRLYYLVWYSWPTLMYAFIIHIFSVCCTLLNSQVICSNNGGAETSGNKGRAACAGDVLVGRVAAVVPGTSLSSAKQALHVSSGDFQGAVQYLKVEKLYRLGLTDKANCRRVLELNSWELQRSASALLDKFADCEPGT